MCVCETNENTHCKPRVRGGWRMGGHAVLCENRLTTKHQLNLRPIEVEWSQVRSLCDAYRCRPVTSNSQSDTPILITASPYPPQRTWSRVCPQTVGARPLGMRKWPHRRWRRRIQVPSTARICPHFPPRPARSPISRESTHN